MKITVNQRIEHEKIFDVSMGIVIKSIFYLFPRYLLVFIGIISYKYTIAQTMSDSYARLYIELLLFYFNINKNEICLGTVFKYALCIYF